MAGKKDEVFIKINVMDTKKPTKIELMPEPGDPNVVCGPEETFDGLMHKMAKAANQKVKKRQAANKKI